MSVCERTSDPCGLSAVLWSIVKEDATHEFPNAVQIATKLFKAFSNHISSKTFCDMILDLKIKALIPVMSEEDFNHAKAFSLLNSLFPVKDEDMEIKSSKYCIRHRKVRTRLLQLLAEDESRMIYIRDYLKYGSCECFTRVIQERVKQFIDVINEHIATAGPNKSVVSTCDERSPTVSHSTTSRSCTSVLQTKQDISDIQSINSVSLSGCDKSFKRNVEHIIHEVSDNAETTVRSNHDRYESQLTQTPGIKEHNECKRRRVEDNEEVMGGVVDATSKSVKEQKDLSSEREQDCSDDVSEHRDCTNQTAEQIKNSSSDQDTTVHFGKLGSYSSCAMT